MANEWGDEPAQANVIELQPGQRPPANEWGDEAAPDAIVRTPPPGAPVLLRDPNEGANIRSTVTGMTRAEAQARGEAGAANLRQGVVDLPNSLARGLLPEGAGAALEGATRIVQAVQADLAKSPDSAEAALNSRRGQLAAELFQLNQPRQSYDGPIEPRYTPAKLARIAQIEAELESLRTQSSEARNERFAGAGAAPFAAAVSKTRADYRKALPVSPEVQSSLAGQVLQGIGQAGFTLPTLVVPGLGPSTMISQLYAEGYDDAVSRGADPATASQAGLANVPAAALEYLGDRLLLGQTLRAARGKVTVGELAASLGATAASGGLTEGAQQAWQNVVASKLVGYDPDRPIDDNVVNAILVGSLVDGSITVAAGMLPRGAMDGPSNQPAPSAVQPSPSAAPAAAAPLAAARAPASAESPPAAMPFTAEEWSSLDRAERLGSLARLSDQQLATLAQQFGGRPAAPESAPAPAQLAANEWGDTPAAEETQTDAPPAASLDELAQLWSDTGVGLRFSSLKSGEIEIGLEIPEAQRGQGVGAVVLGDVQEMADFLRQPVSIRLPKGEEAPKGFERVPNSDKVRYTPGTITRQAGSRPRFKSRADGIHDLLDDINQIGGVPRPPIDGMRGGEWDGWAETFGDPAARLLVTNSRGNIDKILVELNEGYGHRFQSPDDFYSAVTLAIEGRKRAEARVKLEQNQSKFYDAALENKGRRAGGSDAPVPTDELAAGDRFQVRGDEFVVRDITEDGRVIAEDGPDVGTVELPPGAMLHPDKGTLRRGDAAEQAINEWGDLAEDSATNTSAAMLSPADAWRGVVQAARGAVRGAQPASAFIARVAGAAKARMEQALGRAMPEMAVRLDEDLVRKNDKMKGSANSRLGLLPMRDEDYALLPEIHAAPDYVRAGAPRDGGVETVEFFKKVGDVYYVSDAVRTGKGYLNVMRFVRMPADSPQVPGPLRATPPEGGGVAPTSKTSAGTGNVAGGGRGVKSLYRETSAERALDFIDPNASVDMTNADIYFADSPELAIGQGGNKGVILEIDPAALRVIANTEKPATAFAQAQGLPVERIGRLNSQDEYRASVRAVIYDPNKLPGRPAAARRFAGVIAALEKQGWTKTTDAQGRNRVERPVSSRRNSSGAAASPGSASAAAYPGPDAFTTPVADDPAFTALGIELPEAVQFYRQLSGGQYPRVREKLRVLLGQALGVFYGMPGQPGSGRIELRADIFRLVSQPERGRLLAEAVAWAKLQRDTGASTVPLDELVEGRFNQLVKAAEQKALTENPRQALAVFWHEIGHFVDFLPDATLKRGNLLGHLAALKKNLKTFIAEMPGMDPTPEAPSSQERAKLRRQAEKELRARVQEVVEIIRREEPVYRELPITADHITSILKNAQREEFPGLYDWFAGLERADKAAVLRAAMKGVVDERAAKFPRREPTGETRIVEEERRTKIGVEPTAEEIRARFAELLSAELRARGLIGESELRAEADTVMKWWQGVDEVPAYFKTATETWAEMFSAMMNNPAGFAKRAPLFWRAFNNYLANRPEVARIYRDVQDSIKSGAIHRERVLNLRDMWHRDEDNSLLADSMFQAADANALRDTLSLLFNRQTGPIQRRALSILKTNKQDRVAAQALSGLKNYLYRATGWEAFARDLNLKVEAPLAAANLHHDDMSEMLFHSRIAGGDRQQLANPLGWSPKTSGERLEAMRAELGPDRWRVLEQAAADFRQIYETQVIPLLREADILTPELMKIVEERVLYATFAKAREFNPLEAGTLQGALEQRYGKDVTARIYRQIGTLGEIRSPYLATVQKAFSLISTARRQVALKSMVRFLEEHEPQSIIPAQERFVDGRWEPVPMDTARVGTIYTVNKGKPEAYYVPRPIAEMMSHGSPLESQIVGLAHKVLAWPKAVLTELNPGFWPVAFVKDVVGASVQLPKGVGIYRQVPRAWTAARASMLSKPDPLADAALRRLMVISRADNRGEHLGQADELTRILMRMGQTPQLWDAESAKIGRFLRFWMAWKRQGQVLERTIKIASMQHLDAAFPDMPEWEKKRIVNERGGSPDFLEKGRAAPLVDLWMMFYNPWLRGLEAMKTSAERDPRGFTTRFFGTVGLAAAAYWMFEQGLINGGLDAEEAEDKRDMMRSIPERDKRRGFAIPLAWSDKAQGKVAYVVLPFPDTLRMLHSAQRSALQTMQEERPGGGTLRELVSYQGQDLPGMNPMLVEAGKWYDYHVLGRNPYDAFLGRGSLDEDMVTAREGGVELALESLSNVTGGIVYRHRPDRPGETPTGLEKFLQSPVVGNLLGRWVRVSNRGLDEQTDRDRAPVRQREAELRLIADEMIGRQMRGEPWSAAQEELFASEPYLAQRLVNRQTDLMKQATSIEMRAWERAQSVGERTALLEAWAKREAERTERLAR